MALGTTQLSVIPRVALSRDDTPNASAAWWQNTIQVNKGLFDFADRYDGQSTDILAGVLAHELSHCFYHHYSASQPGALWDEFSGKSPLDRVQEKEADILGIRLACQSGFDPEGLITFLKASLDSGVGRTDFESNHPATLERITYLKSEAERCKTQVNRQTATSAESGSSIVPQTYTAQFITTKGNFVVQVHRDWAPLAAERFYKLVQNGFFIDAAFFRVVPSFIVQFGLSADPAVNRVWQNDKMRSEVVRESNKRGTVTFAHAGPNTRTTQLFINLKDSPFLDAQGFAPFGAIVEGMDAVDKIYSGYGQSPDQGRIAAEGKVYLDQNFPQLDTMKVARIAMTDGPGNR